MCPLCQQPITGVGRLIYLRPLVGNAQGSSLPSRICLRCHLGLSPMEYRARIALGMPTNA